MIFVNALESVLRATNIMQFSVAWDLTHFVSKRQKKMLFWANSPLFRVIFPLFCVISGYLYVFCRISGYFAVILLCFGLIWVIAGYFAVILGYSGLFRVIFGYFAGIFGYFWLFWVVLALFCVVSGYIGLFCHYFDLFRVI